MILKDFNNIYIYIYIYICIYCTVDVAIVLSAVHDIGELSIIIELEEGNRNISNGSLRRLKKTLFKPLAGFKSDLPYVSRAAVSEVFRISL